MESIDSNSEYLTWYAYDYESLNNQIRLKGLQDNTRYYVYAESIDLAGNTENPFAS